MPLSRRQFIVASSVATLGVLTRAEQSSTSDKPFDVCVYGGTASGIAAAISAHDQGASVIIIEPSRWLGGMSGGGIRAIDWGKKESVGGLALKLLIEGDDVGMRKQFDRELALRNIPVVFEHRISGVKKIGNTISSITLDYAAPSKLGVPAPQAQTKDAKVISARVFIDCSYEGDLMAQSGVTYTYGRESREEYNESFAGVRPILATYAIDPYNKVGDASSGLLPLIQDTTMPAVGSADRLTMAYCLRWKLSQDANAIPITAPENYDPRTYEIFRRGFQNKVKLNLGYKMRKPGIYTDYPGGGYFNVNSSRSLWAQSIAGSNTRYPEGDWSTRSQIWQFHIDFIKGMYHFLRTDESVPAFYKKSAETTGLFPGIFDETGGWPHQLYVREARRMRSSYVITQLDLSYAQKIDDSVGLASYGIDDWPYATIVHQGGIAISGGEFSILHPNPLFHGIYQLPYRSIVPKADECRNLIVPVCCSASHVAMTSIRMEPVWVILGQSAGIAAAQSLKENKPVQEIDISTLQRSLVSAGQKLSWNA